MNNSNVPNMSDGRKDFFDITHLKEDLKGRSVRGGAITIFAQGCKFVLQTGSMIVLARLLTPADFGLIAMVTALTALAMVIKDMGLSMATIQKENISHAQVSTLFWVNVAVGILLAAVVVALAPVVAWFYGEPRLTPVTMALAGTFIFGGLTVQHQALLRRHMKFFRLGVVEVSAMATSVAAAIIAGLYGVGYWSLVIMHITLAFVMAVAMWIVFPWLPGLPRRAEGIKSMLKFGGNITASNLMNYFARNADKIFIGKFIGSMSLGFYSKAYNLLMLPIQQINGPISSVAIPALSRLQNEPERYRNYYKRAINLTSFITMPMVFIMAALSDEIIRIILGEQWVAAAIIFKVLAFSAVVQPILNTAGWIYVSLGQTDRKLRWGLISCPIIVLSFLVGIPWGVLGVAVSYTICICFVISFPCLFLAFRYSPIRLSDCFAAIIRPLLISIIIYIVVEIVCYNFESTRPSLTLLYGIFAAFATMGFLVLIWPKVRRDVTIHVNTLKILRK